MLRKFAAALHGRMTANGVEAPSVDVMVYALSIIVNTMSIAGLTLLAGAITGEFWRTLLMLAAFAGFRFLTGGYHLKSGAFCIAVSTAVLAAAPHLTLNGLWTQLLTGAALIAVLLLAPANYDQYARISPRHYPLLKAAAAVIVASNFLIGSDALAIVFGIQAAMLPFKEKVEEKLETSEKAS